MSKEMNIEINKLKSELVVLKMQKNSNNLKDTSKIRKKRREIARLLSKGKQYDGRSCC